MHLHSKEQLEIRKAPKIIRLQDGEKLALVDFACSLSFVFADHSPWHVLYDPKSLKEESEGKSTLLKMFRPAARVALRSGAQYTSFAIPIKTSLGRRFASTSPADARRSWKSSVIRWGIAIAGVYYYNTSPVFAEQPQHSMSSEPYFSSRDPDSLGRQIY